MKEAKEYEVKQQMNGTLYFTDSQWRTKTVSATTYLLTIEQSNSSKRVCCCLSNSATLPKLPKHN